MKNFPKVFVIVLNYDGIGFLEKCLRSVLAMDFPNFQVILVDNGSQDGSLEMAKKKFPDIIFLQNTENLGFSKGNNVGIRYALGKNADYVLLLNNDTLVDKNLLSCLVENAQKNSKLGILSPLIFGADGKEVWFSGGRIDWLRMRTIHRRDIFSQHLRKSKFITGCAMFVKRDVFERIGLLDEDFFLYWEDADFCFRARKAGFETAVVSCCKIRHFEASENLNQNKVYWLVLSALIFFQKNSPRYLCPWFWIYFKLRKIYNNLKIKKINKGSVFAVHKAFNDFENANPKKCVSDNCQLQ